MARHLSLKFQYFHEIELPKKIGKNLSLGVFGGILIGGMAGYFVDGSPVTAFMGGFAGKEFVLKLVESKTKTILKTEEQKEAEKS